MSQISYDVAPELQTRQSINGWARFGIGLALFGTTVLVYNQILTGTFINWDDLTMVAGNERLTNPTLDGLRRFWIEYRTGFLALYTPLAYSTWWGIAYCFGVKSATPFHVVSVLMHACNVLLAWMLLERLIRDYASAPAALGAATLGACLFAFHPIQVESVAWISGFNNVIAGTFSLYALVRLVDFFRAPTLRLKIEWYAFSLLGLLLALCSKPTALVTPLIAAVITVFVLRVPLRRAVWALLPWAVLMVPFVLIGQQVQNASFMSYPWYQRPIIVGDTIAFYASKVLLPLRVSADYGRTPQYVLDTWRSQPVWLFAAALTLGAAYWWRRFRWLAIAGLVSAAAIAPTSGVVPFYFQSFSTVADRYFYLGMLGPALLITAVLAVTASRKWLYPVSAALCLLAAMTFHQAISWRSTYFWAEKMIARNPESLVGTLSLGVTYAKDGDYKRAEPYLLKAQQINPSHARVLIALAMYSVDTGKPGEAVTLLMFLLRQNPGYTDAYPILVSAALRNRTPDLAEMALNGVIATLPTQSQAHTYLGSLYGVTRRYAEAYRELSIALQLKPDDPITLRCMAQLQLDLQAKRTAPSQPAASPSAPSPKASPDGK